MKVTRIAQTTVLPFAMEDATNQEFDAMSEMDVQGADLLAEFSGRSCYSSWSRPNETTRKNADYIRSTVHEKGHESIMAHASVTYYITGVSRALTHELIRHRFLAFSELSQRYVSMAEADYVLPPVLAYAAAEHGAIEIEEVSTVVEEAKLSDNSIVAELEAKGLTRKAAREAARAVLPSAMETKIVVSGNIRAWRDFLRQRWSVHADAEIRQLAGEILKDLRQIAPHSVADVPEEPYQ